jgi:hypothetical protein
MPTGNESNQGGSQNPPADPNAQPGGQQGGQGSGGEARFTQADLDRIVQERLGRERDKYKDYDDLKATAGEYKKLQDAQKSELDKAKEAAETAKREGAAALETANQRLLRAAFVAESAKAGVKNPEDAYLLADKAGVKIDEHGNVAGVAEAVKALVDAGRIVLVASGAPRLDGGAGGGERPGGAPALTEAELAMARNLGVKPEDYQKAKQAKAKA